MKKLLGARFMFRPFLALVLAIASIPALACSIPNPETALGKPELVAHAKSIALGKPVHVERMGRYAKWSFEIIESIKGSAEEGKVVTINLLAAREAIRETDFEQHELPEFWKLFSGRLPWSPGACTPLYGFEMDGTYLLFLDAMSNSASAERIRSKDDKWYRFVLEQVNQSTAQ